MGIKRSKIDKYKMGLAENMARDYAMLGEDEIERRKALRDKLWLLLDTDSDINREETRGETID
jgi:hypothetical protein